MTGAALVLGLAAMAPLGAQQAAPGAAVTAPQGPPPGFVAPAEPRPEEGNAERGKTQPGNNAPFWRAVRESGNQQGFTTLPGAEQGMLIQPFVQYPGSRYTTAGEAWRQVRNEWIIPYGGVIILFVAAAVALYYLLKGPIGGHGRHTGRLIQRFTRFEQVVHWSTAITFTILAVSGVVMSFGKFLLLPIMGGALFGWLTYALKTLHNFVGPLFAVSMIVMLFTYLPSNWPSRSDFAWLIRAGGMLGGAHPPSHRFNAGEKIVFWGGLVVLGLVVVVSGFVLNKIVPGLDLTRPQMQVAHIGHAVASMFIIAMFIGHAYMGTIGVSGSYQAMRTGYVDEGWAEEHHQLWYEDIRDGKIPAQRSAPDGPVMQPLKEPT
ncbi:MAG TPA: formate dehydrogenase subunit gamma [Rubrivivax sp.]